MKPVWPLAVFLIIAVHASGGVVPDGFALYSNRAQEVTCLPDSLYTPITLFLVLEHPSCPTGASGWECSLTYSDGLYLSLASLSGDALNALSTPQFQVGSTLPYADQIVLATFSLFATQPGDILIHACQYPSIPGWLGPVYAAGDDPTHLVRAIQAYGSDSTPSFTVGKSECPHMTTSIGVRAEDSSWGWVKCLYK